MSNLKKNLNKVLIGLNAVFIASFFVNWVQVLNIPSFITASNKDLLNVVQILGGASPAKLITRMATIRNFLSDYNTKLIANGRMPKGIPAETQVSTWLIVMMVLLAVTILALIFIPEKKYTSLIPVASSVYHAGILVKFIAFILDNNRLSGDVTTMKPTGIFIVLVLLSAANVFASVLLMLQEDFSITNPGEDVAAKAMIGLNVAYIGSVFLQWLHIQEIPLLIARGGQGVETAVQVLDDYSLIKIFTRLSEARNYYSSNGLASIQWVNFQIWIVFFLVLSAATIIVLAMKNYKTGIPVALISAVNGTLITLSIVLFTNKYNVTRDDIQVTTASPVVMILLVLSIMACITLAVTLAERNRDNYGYVFIAPFFIIFFTFLIYPNIQTLYFTFTDKTTAVADFKVIGFDNWIRFAQDTQFRQALANTWRIWGLNIVLQLGLALFLVFIFYDITWQVKGLGFFRTVFYLPNLITLASVAMLFRILLDWKYGAINQALISMGFLSLEIPWLQKPGWAQFWVAVIGAWMWFGNSFLFLMAGVQGISKDYFEAAKVDGASRFQMFTRITLPLLRPIMLYVTITSLIGGMQIFELPQLLTDGLGAPGGGLLTMTLMLYNQYFKYKNMAYASTVAYGLFFVTMFFTITYYLVVYARQDKGGVN